MSDSTKQNSVDGKDEFEPIEATLIIQGHVDNETHRLSSEAIKLMEGFLSDSKCNRKLIVYDGGWADYDIRNYLPDEKITELDGVEGDWGFSDESINIYEFLEIVDRATAKNPDLRVSVTTTSDQSVIWTQSLLERRATPQQLQNVRII